MASAQAFRYYIKLRRQVADCSKYASFSTSSRKSRTPADNNTGASNRLLLTGGIIAAVGGVTLGAEELELRKAVSKLEKGSKPDTSVSEGTAIQRTHLHDRLLDLLGPYVCSMSHVDIIFGHEGVGKTTAVRQACSAVPQGVLYVDLQGSGQVGKHLLKALTGEHRRGLLQQIRDFLRGGPEQHGIKLLEAAACRFLRRNDKYPVVVFDHLDPAACGLQSQQAPLLQLGRMYDHDSPSLRPIAVLNDAAVEFLSTDADSSTTYRIVAVEDVSLDEAQKLLLDNHFPRELAEAVVTLVGGRLSHLQEAMNYWNDSPRWLSPMRPGDPHEDFAVSFTAHFAEIKKILYWDLDKRLRNQAGLGLWPSATGHAPVEHQSPTDEETAQVLDVMHKIHKALPVTAVRAAIGEPKLVQLLDAQILSLLPYEGPLQRANLHASNQHFCFGSPAMQQYYIDRLAEHRTKPEGQPKSPTRNSWTSTLFGS